MGADATVTELLLGGESGDVDAAEVLGGVGTIVGGKGEVRLLGYGSARFGTIDLRDSSPSVEGGLASRAILVAGDGQVLRYESLLGSRLGDDYIALVGGSSSFVVGARLCDGGRRRD